MTAPIISAHFVNGEATSLAIPPKLLKALAKPFTLPTSPLTPWRPLNTSISCFTLPTAPDMLLSVLKAKNEAATPLTIGPITDQLSTTKLAKPNAAFARFATALAAAGMTVSARLLICGPARVNPSVSLRPRLIAFSPISSKIGLIGSSLTEMLCTLSMTPSLIFLATSITFCPYWMPFWITPPIFLPILSKVPESAISCILSATQVRPSLAASKAPPSMISPVPLMPAMLASPVCQMPLMVDISPL